MAGCCTKCGLLLDQDKVCPNGHRLRAPTHSITKAKPDSSIVGPFPKANTGRRLVGSGIEYFAYTTILTLLLVSSAITLGLMDIFFMPILLLMIGFRDANAGLFSLAKRIGKMRVVEHGTGHPASNGQAILRNSYYLGLTFLMIFPIFITDLAASVLFVILVVVDVFMIFLSREGRRIGDFLAKTQVVHETRHP